MDGAFFLIDYYIKININSSISRVLWKCGQAKFIPLNPFKYLLFYLQFYCGQPPLLMWRKLWKICGIVEK